MQSAIFTQSITWSVKNFNEIYSRRSDAMLILRNEHSNLAGKLLLQHWAADQNGIVKFIPWVPSSLPNPSDVRLHNLPRPGCVVPAIQTKVAVVSSVECVHTKRRSQNAHCFEAGEKSILPLVQISGVKMEITGRHPHSARPDLSALPRTLANFLHAKSPFHQLGHLLYFYQFKFQPKSKHTPWLFPTAMRT